MWAISQDARSVHACVVCRYTAGILLLCEALCLHTEFAGTFRQAESDDPVFRDEAVKSSESAPFLEGGNESQRRAAQRSSIQLF